MTRVRGATGLAALAVNALDGWSECTVTLEEYHSLAHVVPPPPVPRPRRPRFVFRVGWREHAACAGYPTEWWFENRSHRSVAHGGGGGDAAVQICRHCPVQAQCLAEALHEENDDFGIRGGLTPGGRRTLRSQLRRQGGWVG